VTSDSAADARDLAGLLAAGERAAFHGRPGSGVEPLSRAVEAAVAADLEIEAMAAGWLLGVCLGATGRYGGALRVLDPLVVSAQTPEGRLLGALAASTVASVHRQLGRHSVAQGYDEMALEVSQGAGEAGFDGLLGLAADAVGLGQAEAAAVRLAEAAALVEDRPDWWRQRVRAGWVRAEVALLEGRAADAVVAAGEAVELAEQSGAPRHVAKGLLFLGVAHVEDAHPADATAALRRGALLAESLGALPLLWPVRAVLGTLLAESDAAESERSLAAARSAVNEIAADLPDALRDEWLTRPDVDALLGSSPAGGG
jgi:hypothetical protein